GVTDDVITGTDTGGVQESHGIGDRAALKLGDVVTGTYTGGVQEGHGVGDRAALKLGDSGAEITGVGVQGVLDGTGDELRDTGPGSTGLRGTGLRGTGLGVRDPTTGSGPLTLITSTRAGGPRLRHGSLSARHGRSPRLEWGFRLE
ncbi:hypothetical protein ACFV13_28225, partial [Streptomyces bauhiniae]|uniref:hypothetical protein n=1 Tax=Streptomyces bauhiniae TaxID=2340725 RepID=UPI0036C9D96C